MAAQERAHRGLVRVGMGPQEPVERHQDPGRAEAALQGVVTAERLLEHRKPAGLRRQSLDSAQPRAVRLHRERQAGPRRDAVDFDRAGAAYAVLAAHMGAGHAEPMAQEVGEQHARLRFALDRAAVELETHPMAHVGA